MLWRIAYLSSASARDFGDDASAILTTARRKNEADQITGLLVFCDGSVFQVLEGPQRAVEATFAAISRDTRHRSITRLMSESIAHRDFADWQMAWLDIPPGHALRASTIGSMAAIRAHGPTSPEVDILLTSFARCMRAEAREG